MPAGVSWSQYLKFFTAAMFSMVAGAQIVHLYYRPLDDINVLVNKQIEKMKKEEMDLGSTTYIQSKEIT